MPPSPTAPDVAPRRALLALAAGVVLTLIEIEALEYTYGQLGIPHRYFFGLLVASLFGSMVNIPLFALPGDGSGEAAGRATLIAINIGGAVIPTAIALWVLAHQVNAAPSLAGVVLVTAVCWLFSRPTRGIGMAMPMLVPPLAAAGAALLLAPRAPAAVAYVSGTLGTLLGADLLHFGSIRALGASAVSIGGAGTFDGVFLTGLVAVLLA